MFLCFISICALTSRSRPRHVASWLPSPRLLFTLAPTTAIGSLPVERAIQMQPVVCMTALLVRRLNSRWWMISGWRKSLSTSNLDPWFVQAGRKLTLIGRATWNFKSIHSVRHDGECTTCTYATEKIARWIGESYSLPQYILTESIHELILCGISCLLSQSCILCWLLFKPTQERRRRSFSIWFWVRWSLWPHHWSSYSFFCIAILLS